jgi:hypothetical protein
MAQYANQRSITIIKTIDDKRRFTIIPYREQQIAALLLDGNTYKVWTFLMANANLYEFGFSSAYFSKILNLSKKTVKTAMVKLEETTYLVKSTKGQYHMFAAPQNKDILDSALIYLSKITKGGESDDK